MSLIVGVAAFVLVLIVLALIYVWLDLRAAKQELHDFADPRELPPSAHERREAIRDWDAIDQLSAPDDPPPFDPSDERSREADM